MMLHMSMERPTIRPEWESLAERNKETVDRIKKMNFLGADTQAEVILLLLGEKPAAEFSVGRVGNSVEETVEMLRDANLVISTEEKERKDWKWTRIYTARDTETLSKLLSSKDSAEYGALMGYPATATAGFMTREMDERLPYEIDPSIVFTMRLSRTHAAEELAHLKHWSEIIKRVAPDTYNKLLQNNYLLRELLKNKKRTVNKYPDLSGRGT